MRQGYKVPRKTTVEEVLSSASRSQFVEKLALLGDDLTVPSAQRLIKHLRSFPSAETTVRLGVVHTYTSDLLDQWFELQAARGGFDLEIYHAPYGIGISEARADSQLAKHQPDLTLLMLQREDLHPDLRRPIPSYDAEERQRVRRESVERLADIVGQFRAAVPGEIVVTILPTVLPPGLGLYDRQAEFSESGWWAAFKDDLAAVCRSDFRATTFIDLDEMLLDIGRRDFFDLRFWYASRFPFTHLAAQELARRVLTVAAHGTRPKAKVIVLDADNTLWGGIVGEDGMEGIALGPEYPGNIYVDFQRRLLEYQQRGFILALCSKNNPADVAEVLDGHPHQVLRNEHFAAMRVNWDPKTQNLVSIAEELNVGLDSFLFVDDSDYECALVAQELPQVQVVQVPSQRVAIPSLLDDIGRLEILRLTQEDRRKTQMYAQERQRVEERSKQASAGGSIRGYLESLEMKMTVEIDQAANVARLAQLTQKTNQFNLTTRRYSETDVNSFLEAEDWTVASFSLEDRFGHSGIVGLAMLQAQPNGAARIDTFLMSCRVIGREAESAFLECLLRHMEQRGVGAVVGEFLPTPKNGLAKDFLAGHRFTQQDDGTYKRDLTSEPPAEESIYPIAIEQG